jgi:hypothetical protein
MRREKEREGRILIRLRVYLLFDCRLFILKRAYIRKLVKARTLKERCLRKKPGKGRKSLEKSRGVEAEARNAHCETQNKGGRASRWIRKEGDKRKNC